MPGARRPAGSGSGLLVLLSLGVVLLGVRAGRAGERGARGRQSAAVLAEAAQLVATGQQALAARDFAAAERAFSAAYVKSPAPQPLYLLGQCAAQQGRVLEAQDYYRRFEADPAAEPDEAALAELRRVLALAPPPYGRVQVLGEPGAIARVDGRLLGALPLLAPALVAAESSHTLTLEARGPSIPATVAVPAGRFVEVRVNTASRAALITLLPAYIALTRLSGVPAEAQEALLRAMEEGLTSEKKSLLHRELALTRAPELGGCLETRDCQRKLAEKNDAEGVFQVEVGPSPRGAGRLQLKVRLLDTGTGDVASEAESEGEGAALATGLRQAVARSAAEVAVRPRGVLKVLTDPPEVEVYVDDQLIGRAPLERAVWAGRHALRLRKPGYEELSRPLDLSDGQSLSVRESLALREAEPAPSPARTPPIAVQLRGTRGKRPLWRVITGSALAGSGLLLTAIGLQGLAVDGACIGTLVRPGPGSPCPASSMGQVYDSAALARPIFGFGLIGIGVGIGIAAWPGPRIDLFSRVPDGRSDRAAPQPAGPVP